MRPTAILQGRRLRKARTQIVSAWESRHSLTAQTPEATMEEKAESRKSVRKRADEIKPFRCKNLIAVIENPSDIRNIGTVIRNVNALGVEKVYIVDSRRSLPEDWQDMRDRKSVSKTSVSAVKWTFVKRFDSTDECFDHLERKGFKSIVTSPHVKGKTSIFLHEGDYTAHSKLAVWFGSEAMGVSNLAVERSEMCVGIPMFGMIESLNLGTSSGIVLYEVAKQRREYQSRFAKRDRRREHPIPLPTVITPKVEAGTVHDGEG
jgi:tRNA (guanosine-2'-O-)-methyltransferase